MKAKAIEPTANQSTKCSQAPNSAKLELTANEMKARGRPGSGGQHATSQGEHKGGIVAVPTESAPAGGGVLTYLDAETPPESIHHIAEPQLYSETIQTRIQTGAHPGRPERQANPGCGGQSSTTHGAARQGAAAQRASGQDPPDPSSSSKDEDESDEDKKNSQIPKDSPAPPEEAQRRKFENK